jgi:hypothetical protein
MEGGTRMEVWTEERKVGNEQKLKNSSTNG